MGTSVSSEDEHRGVLANRSRKRTGHYYQTWNPWDDACITCSLRLAENLEHYPDLVVDAGHTWTCSMFCRKCYLHDGDCGEEHTCDSPEHLVP